MNVSFVVHHGNKIQLEIEKGATAEGAKIMLASFLNEPVESIQLIHMATPLKDNDNIYDLNYEKRNFIFVYVKQKIRRVFKPKYNNQNPNEPQNRVILPDVLSELNLPNLRQHFLDNPSTVPALIVAMAQTDPENAAILNDNPHLLLQMLGISPVEFLYAVNRHIGQPPRGDQQQQPQATEQHVEEQEVANTVQSEAQLINNFLENLTPQEFHDLEQVVATNIDLADAIPIFLRNDRNPDATIQEINRMRENNEMS